MTPDSADDRRYRAQIAYLLARSPFYRAKLAAAGFADAGAVGGLDAIGRLPFTEKDELRRTVTAAAPIGAHLAAPMAEVVRVYSTSGTTGSPSFIPLTRADLAAWITISSRSYAASGVAAGERIVTTYNAGPFVAGVALEAFHALGLAQVPVGSGHSERLLAAVTRLAPDAVALTPSYALHLAELAEARGIDLAGSVGATAARRRRARRRRAGAPGAARGGMGRARHRGDGHRRHRRLALGRVRTPDGHALLWAGAGACRADRPGDRRGAAVR